MDWRVEPSNGGVTDDKKVKLIAPFPFDCLFDSYSLKNWGEVIDTALEEGRCGIEDVMDLLYFNWLDWHDIHVERITIPEDSVMARFKLQPRVEALAKKHNYEKALLTFSRQLLEQHKQNENLPPNWAASLESKIEMLEKKIKKHSA